MKIRMILAMTVVGLTAHAKESMNALDIYLENTGLAPFEQMQLSKSIAGKILETADVHVQWRTGKPATTPSGHDLTLVIRLADRTPEDYMPGALAFATPYEGVHITIFMDRVQGARYPAVLGHVLAHEITHMLQGISRHSDTGVMKAHWSADDYAKMSWKPFEFTGEDVQLIQAGMRTRAAGKQAPLTIAAR